MRGLAKSVDEYIDSVPEPGRSALSKMRSAIRSVVPPEATETISYRMPAIKYHGIVVWFGAFSDHCSLFPTAGIITSKGTIQFPLDKPVPTALIKKLVKARVAQMERALPQKFAI